MQLREINRERILAEIIAERDAMIANLCSEIEAASKRNKALAEENARLKQAFELATQKHIAEAAARNAAAREDVDPNPGQFAAAPATTH